MRIRKVTLQNFKNLSGEFSLDPGVNLIVGNNGIGKTNFLEALNYLSSGESFRDLSDKDLLNWEKKSQFAKVTAEVYNPKDNFNQELSYLIADDIGIVRKKFQIDGVKKRKIDFVYKLPIISFQPHDISLLNGSPDLRRKEIDEFAKIISSEYVLIENKYKKVLKNRNRLLKDIGENGWINDELLYWDKELVELGSFIISKRLEILDSFLPTVRRFAKEIFDENFENLQIKYISKLTQESKSFENIKEKFLQKIETGRKKEIGAGQSLYGPQRDDLEFLNGEINIHKYGSRGQQRLVALVFKLAMWNYYVENYGVHPVLLLDDMMSELDANHKRKLEKALKSIDAQIIFSSTTQEDFSKELFGLSRKILI